MQEREKYKILTIEDSVLNRSIIQNFLEEEYTLGMATTAEGGYKAVQIFRPDLILLDIILANADGFDLLAQLKDSPETRDIPIIIITGLSRDEEEERGFFLGAADYIRKPLKETILKARIKTQLRILEQIQTIERLALVDTLTGVSNRRHFETQSQQEWKRAIRDHNPLSLMMLDIDHFKSYNDTYGHFQGDIILRSIGQVLKDNLKRPTDLLCRYGGEEFVVILPNTEMKGAMAVAESLRAAVETMAVSVEHISTDVITKVTVSIGVACCQPKVDDQFSRLLKTADQFLYRAKRNGRNRVELAQI